MPVLTPTPAVNAVFRAAQDLPSCVAGLQEVDPALAAQLESKSLLASKSPWGTLAAGAAAWLSGRYGFGWDTATCDLVAGAAVLVAGYAARALARKAATLRLPGGLTAGKPAQS